MREPLHRVVRGDGPDLVLIHGSAADADSWTGVFATLSRSMRLWAYDRRGSSRSLLPPGRTTYSVDEHARDLLQVVSEEIGHPAVACGSSFGAVVALQAARTEPAWFRGLVLCEPPLPASDRAPPVPDDYMDELLRLRREVSSEAAGEFFLKRVLGPEGFAGLHPRWRARCASMSDAIVLDSRALQDYRPRFAQLRSLDVPALLLGGDRSAACFAPALDALESVLPRVQRRTVEGAGHMIHADATAAFNEEVARFVGSLD